MRTFLKHIPVPFSFLIFFATACGGGTSLGADEIPVIDESQLTSSEGVAQYPDGIPIIDGISLMPFEGPTEYSLDLDGMTIIDDSLLVPSQTLTEGSQIASQALVGSSVLADGVSVIDDSDAGFSLNTPASWVKISGQGVNSEYFMGKGSGKATWSFPVNPGSYRVSMTWYNPGAPYNKLFSTVAPVSVTSDATLLKSTTINQTLTPSDRTDLGLGWKDLGVFTVPSSSSSLQVSLSAVAGLYVMADAVRIERIPDNAPIVSVIDDSDAGFSLNIATSWVKISGQGINSEYFMGKGSGKATWTFPVNPGSYKVSMTWYNPGAPYNTLFSTVAPVSVTSDATLLKSTTINQTLTPSDRTDLGKGWKDLGVFTVPSSSSSLQVSLSAVAGLYVMADAVRIEGLDGGVIVIPKIASTVPLNSPLLGGIPVNIFGTEFVNGSQVLFGTNPSPQVTFVSSSQLVALAPPNAPGVFDIKVITPQGSFGTLIGKFKYAIGRTLDDGEPGFQATAPAIAAMGAGFQSDYVYPGGTRLTATASWTTPVRKQQPQKIAVTWYNPGAPYNGAFANSVRFDILDGANILGTVAANLRTTPNSFGDQGVGWLLLGNFAFASGQAKIVLRNTTSLFLVADAIRVQELFPAPILSSAAPAIGGGAGETSVLLSGSQFLPGATVTFGNVPTSVIFIDGTSLKATASSDLIGTDLITVTNPDGQKSSPISFTF